MACPDSFCVAPQPCQRARRGRRLSEWPRPATPLGGPLARTGTVMSKGHDATGRSMTITPRRKRSTLGEQFVSHSRAMRESPAWQVLPDNARRVLDRLELEHMRHGGADNGALPCTYTDFARAGVRRASVALAIRQCVCLGFIEVTHQGGRSISYVRRPSEYRLTYLVGRGKSPVPTNEWQCLASEADALAALRKVEQVSRRRTSQPAKNKKPDALASLGEAKAGRASEPPSLGSKAELLSISRVGGGAGRI
jgi:hypothetical protein